MAKDENAGEDILRIGPQIDDKGTVACLRYKDHQLQTGTLAPIREGQPLLGDYVHLTPREEDPGLYDVEELYSAKSGPAQVNSKAFHSGWDRVFGQKTVNQPN